MICLSYRISGGGVYTDTFQLVKTVPKEYSNMLFFPPDDRSKALLLIVAGENWKRKDRGLSTPLLKKKGTIAKRWCFCIIVLASDLQMHVPT
jgi:hypothetical protein